MAFDKNDMNLFEKIKKIVSNNTVEEIMFKNLKHFYGCDQQKNLTFDELRTKYVMEEFNELEKPLSYFEESIYDIKNHLNKYKNIYEILDDEDSKATFANMMASKVFMDLRYVAEVYCKDNPYFSKNIFSFSEERYIDCGGYDGDTAVDFIQRNPDVQQMYIFEGIPSLAKKCKKAMERFDNSERISIYQKAVFYENRELYFDLGDGIGDSKIKEQGEIKVQGVKLDEIIKKRITFIKMDIEGSEKEAIKGAKRIIAENTPKMAICIYHLIDDFWKIPELILSINSKYHFKVRQCDPACFSETVLYCIPADMPTPFGETEYLGKGKENLNIYRRERVWFLQHIRQQNFELERSHVWNKQLIEAKNYLENQVAFKNSRIDELEKWTAELKEGKTWLETHSKEQEKYIMRLKEAIEFFANQIYWKNQKINELESNDTPQKKEWDVLVSLGYNCEVSFRIQDFLSRPIDSYPFSWCYIIDQSLFLKSLKNLDDILMGPVEFTESGMILDIKYKIAFHGKTPKDRLINEDGSINQPEMDATVEELQSRMGHLIQKFKDLLNSQKSTLFILKVPSWVSGEKNVEFIKSIYNFLESNYLSKKFFLLVIAEKTNLELQTHSVNIKQYENLVLQLVEVFADDSNTETSGDIQGWMNAFQFCKS